MVLFSWFTGAWSSSRSSSSLDSPDRNNFIQYKSIADGVSLLLLAAARICLLEAPLDLIYPLTLLPRGEAVLDWPRYYELWLCHCHHKAWVLFILSFLMEAPVLPSTSIRDVLMYVKGVFPRRCAFIHPSGAQLILQNLLGDQLNFFFR